ncbi:MAG: hypothetical protein WCI71_11385, partial [Bacteroidota bacterium]
MNKRNYCIGLLIILFISLMIPVQLIARDAPITTAGSKNACPGTAVSIPVTVSNFSDITAISLRLDYNPTLLTFTGPANSNTLLSGILVHNSNISSTLSRILISWSDPTPLTLTNGSKIIDLVFTYLSGSTSLVWNNTSNGGQECEYADENGDAMNDVPTANFYLNSTVTPSIVEAAGPISGSSSVCLEVSGITYSVQPIQGATGYNWTVPAGASIISGNNTSAIIVNFSNAAISGDVTVAGTNSCMTGTPSEIAVTVNPLPAAVAGTDRAICLGQSTQIGTAPVTGNTYNWSSNPTGFSSTVANPSVNPLVTTTYTLNETITATGCTKTNSVAVTVNPLPAAVAGTDRAICLGQSTQIGAVPVTGHTYSWTSNPVGYSSTEANPTVNPLATTTYTLTETITVTGCTKTNSVIVTVNPLPAANAGSDRAICLGQSTQIGAATVTGNTYNWTSSPTGFSSTVANPSVNPLVTTTYTLTETITATGCTKTNSIIVTVNPLPAAVAGTDRAICLGQSTQIGAAPVTGNTYNWTSSPTGFSSTVANPSVNPLVTTTYTLTETITATGCTKTNSIIVTVNPLPAAVAGTDRAICLGQSTQIGAAPVTGNTYNWTSSPTGYSSTVANPSVNPLVTTTYTLTETITATGCAKTNSVVVTVNPLPAAVAGTDRAICLGQSTQIGATSATGHTYTWSSNPTGFSSTEANPSVNPLVTTTYTLNETIT